MEAHRLGVKFFFSDSAEIRLDDLIPIFHGWIQRQALNEHLLLDVHDYSHMHDGPGILLVAHEGNVSVGRDGLLYYRKAPAALSPHEHLTTILKSALQACRLLEKDARLKFRMDEVLIIANDRLIAPNDEATFVELQPVLDAALQEVLGKFELTRVSGDSKERLTVIARRELEN